MRSKKPYLLRAYYDWITDSDWTPYLLVNANYPDVTVPTQYVRQGKIVLDISPMACRELLINAKGVSFSARFAGQLMQIVLPLGSIQAIYAKENSEGMTFQAEEADKFEEKSDNKSTKKPFLSIVNNDDKPLS